MSGDNSNAAAVLTALDRWYSKRVIEYYDPDIALYIHRNVVNEANDLPSREHEQLKGDFVWNFPSRAFPMPSRGFFSCMYDKFDGYLGSLGNPVEHTETREMETMTPVFDVRKSCDDLMGIVADLAEGTDMAGVNGDVINQAFGFVFKTPQDFATFSLGYLHTRVLNASIKTSNGKMTHPEYAMKARNYGRVSKHVKLFSETVFGDLVH